MTDEYSPDSLGSPDESRGGPDVDAAVANAEAGSRAEGDHTPSGQETPGNARVEQLRKVVTAADDRDPETVPTEE